MFSRNLFENSTPPDAPAMQPSRPPLVYFDAYSPPHVVPIAGVPMETHRSCVYAVIQVLLADNEFLGEIVSALSITRDFASHVARALIQLARAREFFDVLNANAFLQAFREVYPSFSLSGTRNPQHFLTQVLSHLQEVLDLKENWTLGGYGLTFDEVSICAKCTHKYVRPKHHEVGVHVLVPDCRGLSKPKGHSLMLKVENLIQDSFLDGVIWAKCIQLGCGGLYRMANTKIDSAPRRLVVHVGRLASNGIVHRGAVEISREISLKKVLAENDESSGQYKLTSVVRHTDQKSPFGCFETDILNRDGTWTTCANEKIRKSYLYTSQDTEAVVCIYKLMK